MTSAPKIDPEIRVLRHSFHAIRGGGHLRWTEAAPPSEHRHHAECGCTVDAEKRPSGVPAEVQQEITAAWPDCLVIFDEAYAAPWVKFRRAEDVDAWVARGWTGEERPHGDDDHAYFRFDRKENSVGITVGSPGFGLTGILLTTLFLGNRVDVSQLYNGHSRSKLVDLSKIAPDQVWLHACSLGKESLRIFSDAAEIALFREAFRLASSAREVTTSLLAERAATVEHLRDRARSTELPGVIRELRDLLTPVAYRVEETELFRLAREMEVAIRPRHPDRSDP